MQIPQESLFLLIGAELCPSQREVHILILGPCEYDFTGGRVSADESKMKDNRMDSKCSRQRSLPLVFLPTFPEAGALIRAGASSLPS